LATFDSGPVLHALHLNIKKRNHNRRAIDLGLAENLGAELQKTADLTRRDRLTRLVDQFPASPTATPAMDLIG
jgi:hypothetical protein